MPADEACESVRGTEEAEPMDDELESEKKGSVALRFGDLSIEKLG